MNFKMLLESLDKINENQQLTIAPAQQNTQVIKQGDKTLGAITNPALAQQVKSAIGKGEMTLSGDEMQLKEDEATYSEGDQVSIIGDVECSGQSGTVTYIGKDGKFIVVEIDGTEHSFHSSDIEHCEDCDDTDDTDEYDDDDRDAHEFMESAPPDQEKWVKDNKEKFIKQYGEKKGMEVLYATANKRSKVNESPTGLSPKTLADYKKAAGKDALKSDKEGNFKRADKRFYGIVKATKKEFDNDMRGIKESTGTEYTDMDEWFNAVKDAHPDKRLRLVDRVEGKKKTTSAEVNGQDRSYGVWDNEKETGVVLGESSHQFEAWDKKLANLLSEEFSVSTTTGTTPGAQDSINVYATGEDASTINRLLQSAGIGYKDSAPATNNLGLPVDASVASTDGQTTDYAPEEDIQSETDILDLIKRLSPNIVSAEIIEPETDPVEQAEYSVDSTVQSDEESTEESDEESTEDCDADCDEDEEKEEYAFEEFANEPEEKQLDTDYLTKTISGGLNKQKKSNTVGAPVKVEVDESISSLLRLSGIR